MDSLPTDFQRRMVEVYGPAGREWLEHLPAILADSRRRWQLELGPYFPNLSYNYVAPAVRSDGTPAVLKAGFPSKELRTEIEALRLFDGRGAVRLLATDLDSGVLLLERVAPGSPLTVVAEADDVRATVTAARVMRELRRPAPEQHSFPTVADWAEGFVRLGERFDGGTGPLPAPLVERAEGLYAELLASSTEPVLLHGDLHHDNILHAGGDRWLAIDPKGLAGEPAYEVGALLRNPIAQLLRWPHLDRILNRRIAILSDELGYERARIRDWAFAQAVLSAWWNFEDHGHGWEKAIACAELLARVAVR